MARSTVSSAMCCWTCKAELLAISPTTIDWPKSSLSEITSAPFGTPRNRILGWFGGNTILCYERVPTLTHCRLTTIASLRIQPSRRKKTLNISNWNLIRIWQMTKLIAFTSPIICRGGMYEYGKGRKRKRTSLLEIELPRLTSIAHTAGSTPMSSSLETSFLEA